MATGAVVVLHQRPSTEGAPRAPTAWRGFVLTWVVLLVLGNVIKEHRYTLPFVGWGMFGRPVLSEPQLVRLTAHRPDGTSFRLIPAAAGSEDAVAAANRVLARLAEDLEQAPDHAARARSKKRLASTLASLARMHEEGGMQPPGPLEHIVAEDCRTQLVAPYRLHCKVLDRVRVRQ